MREVFIKYNPYKVETTITVDGEAPRENSKLNCADRRLQEWIEELPEILFEEYSSLDFKVTFHGTTPDYEDVEIMAKDAAKQGIRIVTEHIPAKEVSKKESAIDEIFEEIQNGPFEELKQPDVIRAFNLARSSDFEVNVVATMSAGKSTLINSLLCQKLMPAKQEACTATITEIKDNDQACFSADVYNKNGDYIESYPNLDYQIMQSLNSNPEVSKIYVKGDIPFVDAEDVSLILVDTPGPNNSRDPEHKAATYRMLSESSKAVVLYILNATQLAVNDDYTLLKTVAESMKVGGKQSRDRFIFVVNKLDDFKRGEDSVTSAIEKVRDYLKDNGIENPNIYPASALTALNIRTILAESDDDDDDEVYEAKGKVRKFNRNEEMHFERIAPLTPSSRLQLEKRLSEAKDAGNVNEEALIHSGIVPIELAIKMYVKKYAKTAKIKNIVDTFSKRLESARSFEITKQKIAENQEKHEIIIENIELIKRKLDSGEEAKKFRRRIDRINFDKEIQDLAKVVLLDSQAKITKYLTEPNIKTNITVAEQKCKEYSRFANSLQAKFKVKLENLISDHIQKNVDHLLEEYKTKIAELIQDVNLEDINIDPFELMKGNILSDSKALIHDLTRRESVKVGEEWVKNTSKRLYKPWTWFQPSGRWKDIYEDREYVNSKVLAERFFAPVQEILYENTNNAVEYAKAQTEIIKSAFKEKFNELDEVLKLKIQELEDCAKEEKDIERTIKETESKLEWLERIQVKINSILDI